MIATALDLLLDGQGVPSSGVPSIGAARSLPAGLGAPPDAAAFLRTLSGVLDGGAESAEARSGAESPATRLLASFEREPSPRFGSPGSAESLHPALNQIVASLTGAQDRALRLAEGVRPDPGLAERGLAAARGIAESTRAGGRSSESLPAAPGSPFVSQLPAPASQAAAFAPAAVPPVDVARALAAQTPVRPLDSLRAAAERFAAAAQEPSHSGSAAVRESALPSPSSTLTTGAEPASDAETAGRPASLAFAGAGRPDRQAHAVASHRSGSARVAPSDRANAATPSPRVEASELHDRALRSPAAPEHGANPSAAAVGQPLPNAASSGKSQPDRASRRAGPAVEAARSAFATDWAATTRAPSNAGNGSNLDPNPNPHGAFSEALVPQGSDSRAAAPFPDVRGAVDAPALAAPPAETVPGDGANRAPVSASRIPEALAAHVERLSQGDGGTARIRLHPERLGELHLQIRVRGQSVDVMVVAREAAAQALVAGGREQLAEALSARDLRMENFDVHGGERDAGEGSNRGARSDAGRHGQPSDGTRDAHDPKHSRGDRRANPASDPIVAANPETNAPAPDQRVHFVI